MRLPPTLAVAVVSILVPWVGVSPAAAQSEPTGSPAYRDATLPVDLRVVDLLARMTREEKFWQLYMSPGSLDDPADDWSRGAFGLQIDTARVPGAADPATIARAHAARIDSIQRYFVAETRLGIPIVPFDEALHGLMRAGATAYPQAIALAATFDTALVGRVARAVAAETRARGIRQVLSPVVNLADDVRWGRVEETYGEDPTLSADMGVAFVEAFEATGVIATPKHFVANVGDGGRDSGPIHWSERLLRERAFPPFQAALAAAGARSLMTAYNSVDGVPATQNRWLLSEVLKEEWGFQGFVISDAAATGGATVLHLTEPNTPTAAARAWRAGLDVVFQSTWAQHRPYRAAVVDGLVSDAVLDAAVGRVLRAKFELGLFEDARSDPDEAARLAAAPAHRALAREAAAAAMVLLHDPAGVLPLEPGSGTVAVLGVDATEVRLGGYSGPGIDPTSILEGLRRAWPRADLRYAPGPGRTRATPAPIPAEALTHLGPDGSTEPGLAAEIFDGITLDGPPVATRVDPRVDARWTFNRPDPNVATDWFSVRWTGRVTVPSGGLSALGVEGNDGWRLWLDGELALDQAAVRSYGTHLTPVDWAPGSVHDLRLEFAAPVPGNRVRLIWDAGLDEARISEDARLAEAVFTAAEAEVAVVVVGLEEGEFRDRASLSLPGRQEELVRRVAETGTPVVVVLVGGSAVTMPWLDLVDAVLMAWYPGEAGGDAVADILTGAINPSGRLPITFPIAEGQLPLRYDPRPTGRADYYTDLTGLPLFPFGHGLSYTTFEYADLAVEVAAAGPEPRITVRMRLGNTGDRAGDEVVQLYLADVVSTVSRPARSLRRFLRVHLAPGEVRDLEFRLDAADLALLDADLRSVVEPGTFRVLVGASSRDIRLRGEFDVIPPPPNP